MPKKVIILGGGIAGMSAAQELIERGFQVEVYERRSAPGGKARSFPVHAPPASGPPRAITEARGGAPSTVPGEHGFRFFPGFYRHVVDTMRRIPFRDGTVADNLVDTSQVHVARFGRPPLYYPARFPQTASELATGARFVSSILGAGLDISPFETGFFVEKMFQVLTSCEARRLAEYELVDWWDFVDAEKRSPAYQLFYANAFTRSLVAAKAERASARTIGNIFVQMVLSALQPLQTADRVLNGPTNEVWIEPWLARLRQLGVSYHPDCDVRSIECSRGIVHSVQVARHGGVKRVEGDYFIAALPVEQMAHLLTPELVAADPALRLLDELTEYLEWMNGIQFYLTEDLPLVHGHSIYMDTPWALTSVSQAQFWADERIRAFGDRSIRGILSVCISDWDVAGLNGKQADECTRDEIKEEVWQELKQSLNVGGQEVLRDDMLRYWYLDSDIASLSPDLPNRQTNAEPLLVNYVDTWRLRPEATTQIPNFFLASDYVRTFTDIATMEAANEAARRAVNGILQETGSEAEPCQLWPLHEPEVLAPLRAHDQERFQRSEPWDERLVEPIHQLLNAAENAPPVIEAASAAGGAVEKLANVLDAVGRLRIVPG